MPAASTFPQFPELGGHNRTSSPDIVVFSADVPPHCFLYYPPNRQPRLVFFPLYGSHSIPSIASVLFCYSLSVWARISLSIARNDHPARRGCLRHGEFLYVKRGGNIANHGPSSQLLLSDNYLPGMSRAQLPYSQAVRARSDQLLTLGTGALVLAHSLRDAGTSKKLAVLVTLDSVSAEVITQLKVCLRNPNAMQTRTNPH